VVLRDGPARISEEEKSGVMLDDDADDRLIAIEILEASTRVDGVDTVQIQIIPSPAPDSPPMQQSPRYALTAFNFAFRTSVFADAAVRAASAAALLEPTIPLWRSG
jgi:Protein of unknown function (DUF2283)